MYRYICKHCGAHLDPGEKCECLDAINIAKRLYEELLTVEPDGQMTLKEACECNA